MALSLPRYWLNVGSMSTWITWVPPTPGVHGMCTSSVPFSAKFTSVEPIGSAWSPSPPGTIAVMETGWSKISVSPK